MTAPKYKGYQAPSIGKYLGGGMGLGTALSVGLFILLPLAQHLGGGGEKTIAVKEMEFTLPRPPPPPPELPPPPPPEDAEPPPQMSPPPQMLSLNALNVEISAGVGTALAADWGMSGFGDAPTAEDTVAEMSFFELKDLDKRPTVRRAPPEFRKPPTLTERITGQALLKIEVGPTGRVRVISIDRSPDPRINDALKDQIEKMVFTPPTKDGEPVTTQFFLPVEVDTN